MLGEVSPTLLCPKAATKSVPTVPLPSLLLWAAHSSINCDATPLLSPLMRSLVLFMDVQCTGYHATAPRPLLDQKYLSVLTLYSHFPSIIRNTLKVSGTCTVHCMKTAPEVNGTPGWNIILLNEGTKIRAEQAKWLSGREKQGP